MPNDETTAAGAPPAKRASTRDRGRQRLQRLLVPAAGQRLARRQARQAPALGRDERSLALLHRLHVRLARADHVREAEPGDHLSRAAALVVPAGARLEHERAARAHVLAQLGGGADGQHQRVREHHEPVARELPAAVSVSACTKSSGTFVGKSAR